jgi:hypothetical protein
MRKVLAVFVVALLAGAGGLLYLRQGAKPVTVDAAVKRFRAQAAAEAAVTSPTTAAPVAASIASPPTEPSHAPAAASRSAAPARPAASAASAAGAPTASAATAQREIEDGVYVFDTQGYEQTNAVGGARHDYPAQSTITVHHAGCGWTTRWQPLQERWEQWQFCTGGPDLTTTHLSMYHEFFHQQQQQDFDCPTGVVEPGQPTPGQRWAFTCTSPKAAAANSFTVLDTNPFSVGGQSVPAVHMKVESRLTGSNDGTQVQEQWLARSTGLLLRRVLDNDVMADSPFGRVHYEEHYTLQLRSTAPSR